MSCKTDHITDEARPRSLQRATARPPIPSRHATTPSSSLPVVRKALPISLKSLIWATQTMTMTSYHMLHPLPYDQYPYILDRTLIGNRPKRLRKSTILTMPQIQRNRAQMPGPKLGLESPHPPTSRAPRFQHGRTLLPLWNCSLPRTFLKPNQ